MEYGYSCRDSQAALHLVNQHCAEARRFVNYYSYAVNSYQHALNICYQFGFEETASEILCELSMIATKYGLFEDALQYARKCDPTYAKVIACGACKYVLEYQRHCSWLCINFCSVPEFQVFRE